MDIEESLHPWDKDHLVIMHDLLICCWILFAKVLLRIFASMFISDIGLYMAYLFGFGIMVMVASLNEFGSLSSSAIFRESLSRIGVSSSLNFW